MAFHRVCNEDDIPPGSSMAFSIGGKTVLVFHLEDGYFATQSNCTHLFLPLKKGKILDGCRLQCPFHRAQFDIRTGEVVQWASFPPGIQLVNTVRKEKALETYPVEVIDGHVQVELS